MRHYRFLALPQADISVSEADGQLPVLTGLAVAYNSESRPLPLSPTKKFREVIRPGCFRSWLDNKANEVICTVNHDTTKILGRRSAGTLEIFDSPTGLNVRCTAPNTSYARDLIENIKRRDVQGMSFIFDDEDCDWQRPKERGGLPYCYINRATIHEVCFTSDPAYEDTRVGMVKRNMPEGIGDWSNAIPSHVVDGLRRLGFKV